MQKSKNIIIPVYKNFKICIYKPMIPLKLVLFLWAGSGSAFSAFLGVFLKQRGITLTELSTIFAITPVLQFISPTISGVIADKTGRSKPVLVINIVLLLVVVVSILVSPTMNTENCDTHSINLNCSNAKQGKHITKLYCNNIPAVIQLTSCNVQYLNNISNETISNWEDQSETCKFIQQLQNFRNFSLSVFVNELYIKENECYFNVSHISYKNVTYPWCESQHNLSYQLSCLIHPRENCSARNSNRTRILIFNMALLVIFFTLFSNIFRFLDVTAMSLVKEHDADYGRERFFGIFGVAVISPFLGYLVDATTTKGSPKNYDTAFHFFIGAILVVLVVVYKLKVQIRQPGKNMWKKFLYLLKNPDVISFILVLIILGMAWGFMKNYNFWYLEGLNAPGFLLGLIPSISSLYGLPFLFTSNWWLKKLGATQIFLLGLLGYVISGVGYSLMYNPWLSLLFESSTVFNYHLLWVAVLAHSHSIAPEGLFATVISTAGSIHFSLANKGLGGLVGGLTTNAFGLRAAFRIMAIICLISAIFYAAYLYIRKKFYSESPALETINENNVYEIKELPKECHDV